MHPKALMAVMLGIASLSAGSPIRETHAVARGVEGTENREYSEYDAEKRDVEGTENREYSEYDAEKRGVKASSGN